MKLRFSLQYATQWGESLHVAIVYRSLDGTEKSFNLPMTTQDGTWWQVETAVVESRQHPVASVVYAYQVEDADGRVLRREWDGVRRVYHFDSSKNYVFADQWRDIPLQYHLYSNAYATAERRRRDERVEPLRLPLFRKTLVFRVSAPQLQAGQSVAIVGGHPALGDWNTARYLRMEYMGQHDWTLSVNVDSIPLPLDYKYVIVDDETHAFVAWEEGDNRVTPADELADGQVLVLYGGHLRVKETMWRTAGVVVPVFSLRSERSYGVGDFGDLRLLIDWACATGMKVVQLLPVNDTTTHGTWSDSYPYNIVSCFALHPHYLDLGALGELRDKKRLTAYHRQRRELNALPYTDYEAVERVKTAYAAEAYAVYGQAALATVDFKAWFADNAHWLVPYAEWKQCADPHLIYYIQYELHLQLKAAADYARQKGVVLKGDVPIGVNRDSAETAVHPELFRLDSQTGAPPDAFSPNGQNWGFPTYDWNGERQALTKWFRQRLQWMSQYFDAIRIDHVLGFFRIWEIPLDAVYGVMGHFSPALPFTAGEIEYFGLPFRKELLTRPFINDRVLQKLFGMHADYVRDNFLLRKAYGLYDLKAEVDTQAKVRARFEGMADENSLWIREGLYRLVSNVLFVEDASQPDMYHPRIAAYAETVYEALSGEEKDAYMRLYNNYFYQRHNLFWGDGAVHKLTEVFGQTRMLLCAEDLGMLPDCVAPVLDAQRILSLEIQTLPKQGGYEFAHLEANPYRSVATISTHDMAPLRLWWEESPERTQRYYVTMLQKQGRAPAHLPAHLAEEIIARHLYCPSMMCLLSLQDWLAMDAELRGKTPRDERINTPCDPYNRWQYRMHLPLEQLLAAERYNAKLRTMITRSKRCNP